MNPTIEQTTDFIMQHRKGNAFKDMNQQQVAELLNRYADLDCVITSIGDNGEIVGVVCGIPYPKEKKIFIHNILAIKKGILEQFVAHFVLEYQGWSLEAYRRDKFVEYNTVKLMNKILHRSKERIA